VIDLLNDFSYLLTSHAPLHGIFAPRQEMHLASSRKTLGIYDFQPGRENTFAGNAPAPTVFED
jgi:hypothetical protein